MIEARVILLKFYSGFLLELKKTMSLFNKYTSNSQIYSNNVLRSKFILLFEPVDKILHIWYFIHYVSGRGFWTIFQFLKGEIGEFLARLNEFKNMCLGG